MVILQKPLSAEWVPRGLITENRASASHFEQELRETPGGVERVVNEVFRFTGNVPNVSGCCTQPIIHAFEMLRTNARDDLHDDLVQLRHDVGIA